LDLLGLIRPNRDFSMGYSDFQIRIFSSLSSLSPERMISLPRLRQRDAISNFYADSVDGSVFKVPGRPVVGSDPERAFPTSTGAAENAGKRPQALRAG
jgi:hypothetical protein